MSACKHYNLRGLYRCALENQIPCHECGDFAASDHGVTFETNAACCGSCRDNDTIIGAVTTEKVEILRANDHEGDGICAECKQAYPISSIGIDCICKFCHEEKDMYALSQKLNTVIPDTDAVNHPAHYKGHYPFEVKEVIRLVLDSYDALTTWGAYCLGNELKYRFRAGLKGDAAEDIAKAMKYAEFRREG